MTDERGTNLHQTTSIPEPLIDLVARALYDDCPNHLVGRPNNRVLTYDEALKYFHQTDGVSHIEELGFLARAAIVALEPYFQERERAAVKAAMAALPKVDPDLF
jgi:hypothetical protein